MNLKIFTFCIIGLCLRDVAFAQTTLPAAAGAPVFTTLCIDPSCASLAGGTANLTVKPLTRQGVTYVGDYQLKVSPYFFKSEKGRISILFTDDSLHLIAQGKPVKFAGTATTNGSGKTRPINGTATPSANDRGSVKFAITTVNGALIFTSPYRAGDKIAPKSRGNE